MLVVEVVFFFVSFGFSVELIYLVYRSRHCSIVHPPFLSVRIECVSLKEIRSALPKTATIGILENLVDFFPFSFFHSSNIGARFCVSYPFV